MSITNTQYLKRLAVCKQCPDDKLIKVRVSIKAPKKDQDTSWTCGACGCFVKIKARMKSKKCILGHWPILPKKK